MTSTLTTKPSIPDGPEKPSHTDYPQPPRDMTSFKPPSKCLPLKPRASFDSTKSNQPIKNDTPDESANRLDEASVKESQGEGQLSLDEGSRKRLKELLGDGEGLSSFFKTPLKPIVKEDVADKKASAAVVEGPTGFNEDFFKKLEERDALPPKSLADEPLEKLLKRAEGFSSFVKGRSQSILGVSDVKEACAEIVAEIMRRETDLNQLSLTDLSLFGSILMVAPKEKVLTTEVHQKACTAMVAKIMDRKTDLKQLSLTDLSLFGSILMEAPKSEGLTKENHQKASAAMVAEIVDRKTDLNQLSLTDLSPLASMLMEAPKNQVRRETCAAIAAGIVDHETELSQLTIKNLLLFGTAVMEVPKNEVLTKEIHQKACAAVVAEIMNPNRKTELPDLSPKNLSLLGSLLMEAPINDNLKLDVHQKVREGIVTGIAQRKEQFQNVSKQGLKKLPEKDFLALARILVQTQTSETLTEASYREACEGIVTRVAKRKEELGNLSEEDFMVLAHILAKTQISEKLIETYQEAWEGIVTMVAKRKEQLGDLSEEDFVVLARVLTKITLRKELVETYQKAGEGMVTVLAERNEQFKNSSKEDLLILARTLVQTVTSEELTKATYQKAAEAIVTGLAKHKEQFANLSVEDCAVLAHILVHMPTSPEVSTKEVHQVVCEAIAAESRWPQIAQLPQEHVEILMRAIASLERTPENQTKYMMPFSVMASILTDKFDAFRTRNPEINRPGIVVKGLLSPQGKALLIGASYRDKMRLINSSDRGRNLPDEDKHAFAKQLIIELDIRDRSPSK